MHVDFNQHVEKVFSYVSGNSPHEEKQPDVPVLRSWERSLQDYRIDPSEPSRVRILSKTELRDYTQPIEGFLRIARAGVERLHRQVCALGYSTLLADSHGVAVDWRGDERLSQAWKESGLYLGAVWEEHNEGTCGVGTSLIEKGPITIHRGEHFRAQNANLTCSAAPVLDPFGQALACLDVSALHSPDSKDSQHLALQLVMQSALLIEKAYFFWQFEDQWVLRLSRRRELAEVASECLLALDGQGTILAADKEARQEYRTDVGGDLVGRHVGELFDVSMDKLLEFSGQSGLVWPIRTVLRGHQYFASLRTPRAITIKPLPPPNREKPFSGKIPVQGEPLCLDYLAGADPHLNDCVARMKRVMNKNIPVLLKGETGTGKEMFARAIHNASRRAGKPFVAVNCAAIPESLIESELFGYKEGAFTGARSKGMRGKIQQANGGTLFLDEIGDMPEQLQPRLLRVLAEKEVTPLGSDAPIPVDLHVICATHRNLKEMVAEGGFREDLYYRLNGIAFDLPPLRRRRDLADLVRAALAIEAAEENPQAAIDEQAMAALTRFDWPGNVRQLRNALRYALAICEEDRIGLNDLPDEVVRPERPVLPAFVQGKGQDGAERPLLSAEGPASFNTMEQAERTVIVVALEKNQWQVTKAAEEIGISRATLYRKMEKYQVVPPNKR
jgi:transcriptional regulator of acetoin/glycerol metabolism